MSANEDRRQHARQPRAERVVVQIVSSTGDTLPPGTVFRCSTKDVSAEGLRIQLDRKVSKGFQIELWLEVSNHPAKFFLSGEVKWCQMLEESKRYLIGVKLKEGQTKDLKLWKQALEDIDSATLENVREA